MIILPAIDLIDGKCVRLVKGDYAQKTVYNEDPFSQARAFKAAGATHLHVVDLDAAKDPAKSNADVIKKIAREVNLKIETGGGIRTQEKVEDYLSFGIDKVIIGTAAFKEPQKVLGWIKKYGAERVVLSLDVFVKDGAAYVAGSAWQSATDIKLEDLLLEYKEIKNPQVLCTDVSKDGMLSGPNFELYETLKEKGVFVIASGGVTSAADVAKLKENGADAVIIGKALYEGKIDLGEVLKYEN